MRGTRWKCDADRFWDKVDKNGPIPTHAPELGPCWIWTASTRAGYGQFRVGGRLGRMAKSHRVSWEMEYGVIPETSDSKHGTCVCHACDREICVNPGHLFLGTQRENISDRNTKLRTGHKLTVIDVKEIRRLRGLGASYATISGQLAVSAECVGLVLREERWTHVR